MRYNRTRRTSMKKSIFTLVAALLLTANFASAFEKGQIILITIDDVRTAVNAEDMNHRYKKFKFPSATKDFIKVLEKEIDLLEKDGYDCSIRNIFSTKASGISVLLYCDDTPIEDQSQVQHQSPTE